MNHSDHFFICCRNSTHYFTLFIPLFHPLSFLVKLRQCYIRPIRPNVTFEPTLLTFEPTLLCSFDTSTSRCRNVAPCRLQPGATFLHFFLVVICVINALMVNALCSSYNLHILGHYDVRNVSKFLEQGTHRVFLTMPHCFWELSFITVFH